MANSDTAMTLTGVYSGLKINMTGSSGTSATAAAASAQTGYKITSEETTDGKTYNVISVAGTSGVQDPPSVVVTVDYSQESGYDEVDLDVKYTDIPAGTSLQVECSQAKFNISKQGISGSSLVGSIGKDLGPFDSSIDIRLWITQPNSIKSSSALTLSMSKLEGSGGPVKKVLLEKAVVKLSA